VKFAVWFLIHASGQTDRQTYMLIAMIYTILGDEVMIMPD